MNCTSFLRTVNKTLWIYIFLEYHHVIISLRVRIDKTAYPAIAVDRLPPWPSWGCLRLFFAWGCFGRLGFAIATLGCLEVFSHLFTFPLFTASPFPFHLCTASLVPSPAPTHLLIGPADLQHVGAHRVFAAHSHMSPSCSSQTRSDRCWLRSLGPTCSHRC